jgi:hypothetical protein
MMEPEGPSSFTAPVLVLFRKSVPTVTFSVYYPVWRERQLIPPKRHILEDSNILQLYSCVKTKIQMYNFILFFVL